MYQLGSSSEQRLQGVDQRLIRCVRRAIEISTQDFSVHEGVRSLATQREYVRKGASQTMASRHLKQSDGLGKAVDLVPWAGGMLRWEWPLIWPIAEAMRLAARELHVPIRWGGGWFRLDEVTTAIGVHRLSEAYVLECRAAKPKRSAFLDGPHFEIPAGL